MGSSITREIEHFDRLGVFLDGSRWSDQPVKFLARIEVYRKLYVLKQRIGAGQLEGITEGERNMIEWLEDN